MDKIEHNYIKGIEQAVNLYLDEKIEVSEMEKLIEQARHKFHTAARRLQQHI